MWKTFFFAAGKEAAGRTIHRNGAWVGKATAAGQRQAEQGAAFLSCPAGACQEKEPLRMLSGGGKKRSRAFGTENDRKQGIFSLDRGEKR